MTLPETDEPLQPTDAKRIRKASALKTGPPRPPNAWILYRSEKLKAIAAGERMATLEEILAEQQSASSTNSAGTSRGPSRGAKPKAGSQSSAAVRKGAAKGKRKKGVQEVESERDDHQAASTELQTAEDHSASKAVPQAEISKVISLMWRREKKEEKARFERMAAMKKVEHSLKYPDYKFQPMKREEKQRLKEEMQEERAKLRKDRMVEKARGRKKATKPKPTVTLVEIKDAPSTDFAEPSSGPVEKKSKKNARSKKKGSNISGPQEESHTETLPLNQDQPHFPQGQPYNLPQEPPQGLARALPQDPYFARRPSQDLPPGLPYGSAYNPHHNASERFPGDIQGHPQGLPEAPAQGFQRDLYQAVPQGVQHDFPQGAPASIPQELPQAYWRTMEAPVLNYHPAVDSEAYLGYPRPPPPMNMGGPAFHPHLQHPPYHLSYAVPHMQPGFAVGDGEVVPYIFEPMPLGMSAPRFDYPPPIHAPSRKEEPAMAMMGPVDYQPLGVSEAELAEMWALLQEDEVDQNSGNVTVGPPMMLGDAWQGNTEAALDAWSQFGQPLNETEEQEEIPLTQLSGTVVSQIADDWAGYHRSSAFGSSLETPIRQSKVSGYTGPAYTIGAIGSSPGLHQSNSVSMPRYMAINLPTAGSLDRRIGFGTVYQGPPLSSQGILSPLGEPVPGGALVDSPPHNRGSGHFLSGTQQASAIYQRHSPYSSDFRLPTPPDSTFYSNQLTPPTYCNPIPGFSGSRRSSISGEPAVQRVTEGAQTGDTFRHPSFADPGRVLSGVASIGTYVEKEAVHGTPYSYRDFSIGSVMSRSASIVTTTSAERENREAR